MCQHLIFCLVRSKSRAFLVQRFIQRHSSAACAVAMLRRSSSERVMQCRWDGVVLCKTDRVAYPPFQSVCFRRASGSSGRLARTFVFCFSAAVLSCRFFEQRLPAEYRKSAAAHSLANRAVSPVLLTRLHHSSVVRVRKFRCCRISGAVMEDKKKMFISGCCALERFVS